MYDKTDGKQVNHFIIGTEDEGISVAQLYYIAEVAADYFFSCITDKYEDQKSFQCFIRTPYVGRGLKKQCPGKGCSV